MTSRPLAAATALGGVAIAAFTGALNGPVRPSAALWYALLRKPRGTPPGAVVGAVWTALEALLAASGYRLLRAPAAPGRDAAIGAWVATLGGLAGYPWLFFGRRRLVASEMAAAGMLAAAVAMVAQARRVDRGAALLAAPILPWLAFATVLSHRLSRRNPWLSRD